METESEELLHAGVKLAQKTWTKTKDILKLNNDDFKHIICHQVGIAHRNLMFEKLELDLKTDHTTFDKYGNTGSAALPLTLIKASEERKFQKGDKIALLGIGSGLHSIMLGVEW
jgi:3-oxoacyl-[acyl-carrier-protein] synthase III